MLTQRLASLQTADPVRARRRWSACGGEQLTGAADGPGDISPARVALAFDDWAAHAALSARRLSADLHLDGAGLMGERVATHGVRRRGRVS